MAKSASGISYTVESSSSAYKPYKSLSQDSFQKLVHRSGLDKELRNAAESPTRLPFIYQPKPFVVVAREVGSKKPIGVAGFVQLGEYDFLSTLAVDKAHQNQGIGKELVHQGVLYSRNIYKNAQDSGHASLATLTASNAFEDDATPNKAFKKYGFQKLQNAAVLTRKMQKDNPQT